MSSLIGWGQKLGGVSASAWSQARHKLRHSAFIELNERAVLAVVYGPKSGFEVRRWKGRRVLALDSSMLHVPGTAAMRQEFGWVSCCNQKGDCGERVQARLSVLSDVLNRLALETRLVNPAQGERALAAEHLKCIEEEDITLMDRGYTGYELWARWIAAERSFVCRCARNTFGVVEELIARDREAQSVQVSLPPPNGRVGSMREQNLPEEIGVRFVTVRLKTGELEVLATNLLDQRQYPTEAFGELYGYRWGIETYFGLLKGRLDLEHFSGRTVEAVRQDVYATVLLSNLETVLTAPVQRQMEQPRNGGLTVNRAVSFHTIKLHLMELLLSSQPIEEVIQDMQALFGGTPIRKRPGRRVVRRKPSAWRSYHYQRFTRKRVF